MAAERDGAPERVASVAAPELRLVLPPDEQRQPWIAGLLAVAAVTAATSLFAPVTALSWLLPWGAVAAILLVLRLATRRPRAIVVGARGLRVERSAVETFTPWSRVARLVDDSEALVAELHSGETIRIDLATMPDVRAILALAPGDVVYTRVAPTSKSQSPTRRSLGVWLLIVVVTYGVWLLVQR